MAGRLDGKVALVSGGASGIGAAHVRVFAREGAKVVAGDLQDELGEQVCAEVRDAGGDATYVHLDVTDPGSWKAAIDATVSTYGGLTTLINNAGIFHPGGIEEETDEGWARMIAVNQTGVLLGMRTAMAELKRSGNAAIVNMSSLYGLIGSPSNVAYHATKGAVRLMTKSAALEYVKQGVRVNSVHPGQIETPILGDITPEMDEAIRAAIPSGQRGEPDDIAFASLYLCSDEAKYVTGVELPVDAGWSAS
jgi:2,5-dichloro-2,5-cyclohexadiene-1,4-diol dehydrogenase 2